MGKTGKALKKRRLAQFSTTHVVTKVAIDTDEDFDALNGLAVDSPISSCNDPASLSLGGAISESELFTTIKTLTVLSKSPELITQHRAQLKRLRGAIFDFQRVASEQEGALDDYLLVVS